MTMKLWVLVEIMEDTQEVAAVSVWESQHGAEKAKELIEEKQDDCIVELLAVDGISTFPVFKKNFEEWLADNKGDGGDDDDEEEAEG